MLTITFQILRNTILKIGYATHDPYYERESSNHLEQDNARVTRKTNIAMYLTCKKNKQ